MRIAFLILVLFTLVAGRSSEVATGPTRFNSDPDVNSFSPAVTDVAFIDTLYAWAIDRRGAALYHTDSGSLLRKQATNFDGTTVLSFVDRKTGFAFSQSMDRGRLWRTTDGGKTWQKLTDFDQTQPDFRLTSPSQLHFVDRQHGWLLASLYGVWRTEDGGMRWQKVFRTIDRKEVEQVRQGTFSGINGAMIVTTHGIYVTVDGGKTWKLTNNNQGFSAIHSIDKNTAWVWRDSLFRTDDGGNTWHELYAWKSSGEIFSTHFIDKNEGWAAGLELPESFGSVVRNPDAPRTYGVLLHTEDGGKNWTRLPAPTETSFFRVAFSDSKHGWLVGINRLYRTVDGGLTWTTALNKPGS